MNEDEDKQADSDDVEPAGTLPEVEIAELKDRLLRTLAEMENLRQRTRREIDEAQTYGVTRFARDLLDVADNLRRAIDNAPGGEQPEAVRNLVTGVEMTEQALLATFERNRIRKVTPERGERFDHKLHQAVFELPTDELPTGSIAEVLTPGYVIGDRLLRAAMVGVAKATPPSGPAEGAERGSTVDTSA